MRLKNDTNNYAASFNITPPYQMLVLHSKVLIYPREIYQRGVERKRVEMIAADFNEYIANEPKISFRNGKYYVVNGQHMLRKDMEVAQKEVSRAKSELDLKDDERNALKDEMIRVIRGKSSIDRDMIQQLLDENQAAIQAAQDALTAAQNKLEEIEQENKKAENDCSNLFTWASTYQNASFQQRQTILNQFIKEVRVGRDYDIEIILNVPLEEFEEFKSHSLSVRTPSGRKTDLKQAPVRGLGTPNGGIVVFDKTSGEAMNIMPKSSAHVTLRCQDE